MSRRLLISNDEDIDDYEAGHTSYDDDVHNDDGCNDDDGDDVVWNECKTNHSNSICDGGEDDRVVHNENVGTLVIKMMTMLITSPCPGWYEAKVFLRQLMEDVREQLAV